MVGEILRSKAEIKHLLARLGSLGKRAFDMAVATGVLIFLSPLYMWIVLAIRRDSPGPVLYRGARLGKDGRVFQMLKFRTMYETPASYAGPKVTAHDDPRVTTMGRWLRATKLNELPQFWNVLVGEMSLVGPRPEDPAIARSWPTEAQQEILSVRPGITSPASIEYRNEEGLLSSQGVMSRYMQELAPDKLRLDQLYVRYRSLALDLDVLLWTFLLLMPRLRSYPLPEQFLFVGPFTRLLRRYLSWFTIDLLITFLAIGCTALIWRAYAPLNIGWPKAVTAAACFAFLFSLCGAMLGVNRIRWSLAASRDAYDLLPAWILAVVITLLINHTLGIYPAELLLAASALALVGFIVVRYRSRLVTGFLSRLVQRHNRFGRARERVLVIGAGPAAQHAAWLLEHPQLASRFQIVGFVDNDLFKQGMRVYGAHVLGHCKDTPRLIQEFDVGLVLVADQRFAALELESIRQSCGGHAARLLVIPDMLTCLEDLTRVGIPVTGAGSEDFSPCHYCLARLEQLRFENQPEVDAHPRLEPRSMP